MTKNNQKKRKRISLANKNKKKKKNFDVKLNYGGLNYQEGDFFEAEAIRAKKIENDKVFYLVKWKDWPEVSNTWEPPAHLKNIKSLIREYEEKNCSDEGAKQKIIEELENTSSDAELVPVPGAGNLDDNIPQRIKRIYRSLEDDHIYCEIEWMLDYVTGAHPSPSSVPVCKLKEKSETLLMYLDYLETKLAILK